MPDQRFGKNCVEIPQNYSCAVEGCAVCDSGDQNSCSICGEEYMLVDSMCNKIGCSQDCLYCLAPDTCSVCAPGFFLSQLEGNCQPHGANATACSI